MRYPVVNLGGVLKYFDVPTGAFPVPWGPEKEDEERKRRRMGVIPAIAFGYPFDIKEDDPIEYVDVRLVGMGQAAGVTCEDTPEGGKRCSDGTYHPPGCPTTPGTGIQAAPPSGGIPVFPLAVAGVAAAAGAIFLLSGRRMGAEPAAFETSYPEAAAELHKIADNLNRERSNDAYYFQKYIDASKRRLGLVSDQGNAEKALAEQQRIWESAHRNADQLAAAQANYDRITAELQAAGAERDENKTGMDYAQRNIATYRNNADVVISGLPPEAQDDARRIIDPCYKGPAMKGPSRFEGITHEEYLRRTRMSGRGIPTRPIGLFR